jgi:hypothetical protein
MDRDERNGLAILAVIAILFVLVAVALSSQLRYEAPEASMLVPLEPDWGAGGRPAFRGSNSSLSMSRRRTGSW